MAGSACHHAHGNQREYSRLHTAAGKDELWLVRRYVGIDVEGSQGIHEDLQAAVAYNDKDGEQSEVEMRVETFQG